MRGEVEEVEVFWQQCNSRQLPLSGSSVRSLTGGGVCLLSNQSSSRCFVGTDLG